MDRRSDEEQRFPCEAGIITYPALVFTVHLFATPPAVTPRERIILRMFDRGEQYGKYYERSINQRDTGRHTLLWLC